MEHTTNQPARDEPRELDGDTETRLLEAAGRVFAEKGFDSATVRDVCERAGVKNIGAVNYYFRSKENLYEAAVRNAFRCRMARATPPEWPVGTPPAVKLRQFIRGAVKSMLDDFAEPWQMQLLMRELTHPGPAGEGIIRDFMRPIYERLWDILREVLPPGTDERTLHLIGFSIMGQCFYHRVGRPVLRRLAGEAEHDTYDPELLAEHIARFSLAALGLEAPAGTPLPMPQGEGGRS
jgi:TetR/AcrR family transcriptional regulator, regulator of cefoperazone and chloramphenicol sensitivity